MKQERREECRDLLQAPFDTIGIVTIMKLRFNSIDAATVDASFETKFL